MTSLIHQSYFGLQSIHCFPEALLLVNLVHACLNVYVQQLLKRIVEAKTEIHVIKLSMMGPIQLFNIFLFVVMPFFHLYSPGISEAGNLTDVPFL